MSMARILFLCLILTTVQAAAEEGKRYVCTDKKGDRRFTEQYAGGCQEIPLEPGWKNFGVTPSVIVDIKPGDVISERDGITVWMRFFLAEDADDVKGKWVYDYVESLNKFYCGKRETTLIEGTYKFQGETVYVRSPKESITETVDPGTVNDSIYRALCEDDQ
ncbi:MAG TPA: hypothetical protein VJ550_17000 [Geomonas sp.]|nr:hypothetical protein [Geomonas sp.]